MIMAYLIKKCFVFVHQHGGYDVAWKPPIPYPFHCCRYWPWHAYTFIKITVCCLVEGSTKEGWGKIGLSENSIFCGQRSFFTGFCRFHLVTQIMSRIGFKSKELFMFLRKNIERGLSKAWTVKESKWVEAVFGDFSRNTANLHRHCSATVMFTITAL